MVKPGTFIFWDASRLFWFKCLLDNISIRFMRSFSSQTKYTGEFWKAYEVKCSDCEKVYIGESGRELGTTMYLFHGRVTLFSLITL